jgi:AcrR family transcriptional regulator
MGKRSALPASEVNARADARQIADVIPAAERIVEVARELFCRDGIHATGIDRILAAASASKMTLYSRFGSKEALLREVLAREGAERRAEFIAVVQGDGGTPLAQLHRVPQALATWFNGGRFYGCAFMNATAEHATGDKRLRELAAAHHALVLGFLETLAREAGFAAPSLLARQILLIIDGATAALMVTGDPAVIDVSAANIGAVLAQAKRSAQEQTSDSTKT